MEMVDILDPNGNITGTILDKERAHTHHLLHPKAQILITDGFGHVLLQRRGPWPAVPLLQDVWDFSVACHMSAGEVPLDTLARELREELGISLSFADYDLIPVAETRSRCPVGDPRSPASGSCASYNYNFAAVIPWLPEAPMTLEQDKTLEVDWIPIALLQEHLRQPAHSAVYLQYAHRPPVCDADWHAMIDGALQLQY